MIKLDKILALILVIIWFSSINIYGQCTKNSLPSMLYNFLELKGEIKSKDIKQISVDAFYINELIDMDHKLDREFGIYKFRFKNVDDTGLNVFIIQSDSISIFDMDNPQYIVKEVLQLRKRNPDYLSDSTTLKYIAEINNLYVFNKHEDVDRKIITKMCNSFKMFITLGNYDPK